MELCPGLRSQGSVCGGIVIPPFSTCYVSMISFLWCEVLLYLFPPGSISGKGH